MRQKKTIAILGATGAQGGGLARAILADRDGPFAVRALTRDPHGQRARELAELGAEVVACDVDDPESLKQAFRGAYGAFCVTFYWAHLEPERERKQVGYMARAARAAELQHVVWSTLDDTRQLVPLDDPRMPTLAGKYKVPHYDAKGESNALFTEQGVPVTFFNTSFYWDNLIHFGMGPRRGEDGKLAFVLPMADKKLPGIAAEDIGRCALGVFKQRERFVGQSIGVAGEHLTGEQMASALSRALGEEVSYQYVPPEVYRTFDFPGADDLGNMFQYKRDFEAEYCGARPLALARELNPSLQTFAQWLEANADRIPIG